MRTRMVAIGALVLVGLLVAGCDPLRRRSSMLRRLKPPGSPAADRAKNPHIGGQTPCGQFVLATYLNFHSTRFDNRLEPLHVVVAGWFDIIELVLHAEPTIRLHAELVIGYSSTRWRFSPSPAANAAVSSMLSSESLHPGTNGMRIVIGLRLAALLTFSRMSSLETPVSSR